jgi:AraC-like DNA-binding protein
MISLAFERIPILFPDPAVPIVAYSGGPQGPRGKFHAHTDEDWELCYLAKGVADYRVGADELRLQAGDLLIIGPDEPHLCLQWQGERFIAIFRNSVLRRTGLEVHASRSTGLEIAGMCIPPRTEVMPRRRPALEYLLDRLHQESFGDQPAKLSMCALLLAQLLLELVRNEGERNKMPTESPNSAAKKVIEHLALIVRADLGEEWTLGEMVKRSGYSSTQLGVLFRRATGLSPCQWISQERIHRACQLLAHTEQPALQVGVEVGFGTRSQFYRAFRKVTGTTPDRYRSAALHEGHPS